MLSKVKIAEILRKWTNLNHQPPITDPEALAHWIVYEYASFVLSQPSHNSAVVMAALQIIENHLLDDYVMNAYDLGGGVIRAGVAQAKGAEFDAVNLDDHARLADAIVRLARRLLENR